MPSPASDPLGLLLTGGRARRLGGLSKATLTYGNQTFEDRLVGVLAAAGCAPVIRAVAHGDPDDAVHWSDPVADLGPLGAWLGAARRVPGRTVISVPVDMPAVEARDLRDLLEAPGAGWLRAGERDHWVLARLDPEDLAAVEDFVETGGRSAASFWTTRPAARPILARDPARTLNVNTPGDLSRLDDV